MTLRRKSVTFWLTPAQVDALIIVSGRRIQSRPKPASVTWASLERRELIRPTAATARKPIAHRVYKLTPLGRRALTLAMSL